MSGDQFEIFVAALEDALHRRMDAAPADSPQCAALFDVYMAVKVAARVALPVNQSSDGRKS